MKGGFVARLCKVFGLSQTHKKKIGLLCLEEIHSPEPTFDLRLRSHSRGQGIGKRALQWACEYVFATMPDTHRFGGYTREDNIAMRKIFRRNGFVKEGHYRKSWLNGTGNYLDSIYYGITREDWQEKKITPVNWHDEE